MAEIARKLRIAILSLFPGYFRGPFDETMIKRARDKGLLEIDLVNIRDFASDKHSSVDDRPYGGGPGMVMMPGPVVEAVRATKREGSHVVYFSPQGTPLTALRARELAEKTDLVCLCGHYEGVDQRVIDAVVDEEISIGDYVLTSGCPAAVVFVDAVARFIEGVVGNSDGVEEDSFEGGLLDWPHYTRPVEFEGAMVPEVLLSGHHDKIRQWREEEARKNTEKVRPDLLKRRTEQ